MQIQGHGNGQSLIFESLKTRDIGRALQRNAKGLFRKALVCSTAKQKRLQRELLCGARSSRVCRRLRREQRPNGMTQRAM